MKLFTATSLLGILLMIVLTLFSINTNAEQAIINSDHLNVRTGPGTHFEVIQKIHTDEVYEIVQIQDDWAEIKLSGKSGWVTTEYITIQKEQDKEKHSNQPMKINDEKIFIKNNHTQIREGPSIEDDIIFFADEADIFKVTSEHEDWYEIQLDQGFGYLYKPLADQKITQINHLKGKTIVIDAGHGGHDVGSISTSGLYEKDLTMQLTMALREKLTMFKANVILTRESDRYIRLGSRPALANIHSADAFVSIHFNSFPDLASVSGIDTYYYDDRDKQLAQIIQQRIIEETGAVDRGIAFGNYQVIRQNIQPGILLELGFLSNDEEEQLLLTDVYQEKIVRGIIKGLTTYFSVVND